MTKTAKRAKIEGDERGNNYGGGTFHLSRYAVLLGTAASNHRSPHCIDCCSSALKQIRMPILNPPPPFSPVIRSTRVFPSLFMNQAILVQNCKRMPCSKQKTLSKRSHDNRSLVYFRRGCTGDSSRGHPMRPHMITQQEFCFFAEV